MTTSDPNRLDRIEAILERSIVESDQRQREAEQRQLEAERQQQASNERLTRIEELVAQTIEITQATLQISQTNAQQIQSNMQITQSNARSIEAISTQFEETKRLADRVFQRMDSLTQQLAASMSSRNEDRDLLRAIKAGIDKLLRRSEQ